MEVKEGKRRGLWKGFIRFVESKYEKHLVCFSSFKYP